MCLPSLLDIFSKNDLHNLYADLFRVITIVATMPITVASCERTHSKVKIINNYLRAAMSPDRLEDLVQKSSEQDIADNNALSNVVDVFNRQVPNEKNRKNCPVKVLKTVLGPLDIAESNFTWGLLNFYLIFKMADF